MLRGFWMTILLLPVIVPYFKTRGLGMYEVYLLQTFFSFTVAIFEVPSGYIADLLGRKASLALGAALHATGFTLFLVDNIYWLFFAEFVLGIGVSLFSGSDVALIYDSLEASEQSDKNKLLEKEFLGKKFFYSSLGETIGGVVGGLLAAVSLGLVAKVNALLAWIPFFIALTLKEPPREKMNSSAHKENFSYILGVLFKENPLLKRILFFSMFYSMSSLIAVWSFQDYWAALGIPVVYFGWLWAGSNLYSAFAHKWAHKVENQIGSMGSLILIGVLPVLAYMVMGVVGSLIGLIAVVLFQSTRALNSVLTIDAINRRVKTDMRATANSFVSLGLRIGFCIFGPLFGYLLDKQGRLVGNLSYAALYIVIFFLVAMPLLARRKEFALGGGEN